MQQLTTGSEIQIQPRVAGHLQTFQELSWESLQTQRIPCLPPFMEKISLFPAGKTPGTSAQAGETRLCTFYLAMLKLIATAQLTLSLPAVT